MTGQWTPYAVYVPGYSSSSHTSSMIVKLFIRIYESEYFKGLGYVTKSGCNTISISCTIITNDLTEAHG